MSKKSYEPTAKAATKPTPENNPELKDICDRLAVLATQIMEDLIALWLSGASTAEIIEMEFLDRKVRKIQRDIGCAGVRVGSTTDQIVAKILKAVE